MTPELKEYMVQVAMERGITDFTPEVSKEIMTEAMSRMRKMVWDVALGLTEEGRETQAAFIQHVYKKIRAEHGLAPGEYKGSECTSGFLAK